MIHVLYIQIIWHYPVTFKNQSWRYERKCERNSTWQKGTRSSSLCPNITWQHPNVARAAIWLKTLSVHQCDLLIYSYIIVLSCSLGCIQTLSTCQTPITLITLTIESFLSSEQISLTLSVQRRYLLTCSYDIVLLYSLGCIHPIATCQTLITPMTLVTESCFTISTENVNAICILKYNTVEQITFLAR